MLRATTILGVGAAITGLRPEIATAQAFQFSQVQVTGNQRVSDSTILGYAQIPTGAGLTAGELNAAYQRVVNSGLFETVEIDPRGGTLVIAVQEFPTVSRISFEGNARLGDEELSEIVSTIPRRVYNPATVEADARALAEAYEQQGRLAATVAPRIIRRADNQVDLVFEIAEGGVVEIERLSFVGNRDFSDRRLRRVLQTKQAGLLRSIISSDTFVEPRVEFDRQLLTDFYQARGYIDFRIQSVSSEFSRDRDAFFLQFNVQEGQQWSFGDITASTTIEGLDAREFLAVSRIDPGAIYSPQAIDTAIERMERLATRRGLNFVRATPQIERNPRTLTLDVNFLLERGPRIFVERIDIEGNATTLDRVIRRRFDTVEGDPFNPREIRAAAERIRALGYFANVDVESSEGSAPDQVVIDVDVEEQPTGSLSFGGSFSTDSGFGLNIGYQERNFLGRGQRLAFNITTGTSASEVNFAFSEPSFLGRDLTFGLEAFAERTSYDEAAYNTESIGFGPSIAFPISENGRLSLRYRLSRDELSDVDDGDPDDPDDTGSSPILQREEGDRLTSSIGYTYTFDNRRSGLDPEAGLVFRFGQDFAGLGGDVQYVKTTALAGAQTRVWDDEITLQATLEGGAINPLGDYSTTVTDRFFLSTRQLRGFEPLGVGPRDLGASNEDALGGNYFAALRLEANFPIGIPEEYGITGGVFADAGSVWGLDDIEGADGSVEEGFNIRSSVGVSVFWTTPFGPLRFDFSEAVVAEEYDRPRSFAVSVQTDF